MSIGGHFYSPLGDECRQLVRGHSVGRVAWQSKHGLEVLPVAYRCNGDDIYFRVDAGSVMGELVGPIAVTFEVDDIDVSTSTGWSVVVRGEASAHDGDVAELPQPWAPGHRDLTVVIKPSAYSGRAVSAAL